MAGQIRVNTEMVSQIARELEQSNDNLLALLEESKRTFNNLKNTWEGEAANTTIDAYNRFAAKYFENYHEAINQYVVFLRTNVDAGYTETEIANTTGVDEQFL